MLSVTKSLERRLSNANTKQHLNVSCQTLPNTNYRNQNSIVCRTVNIKYLANSSTVWLPRKTNMCRNEISEGREDQTRGVMNEGACTVAVPPIPPNWHKSCEEGWGLTISLLSCFRSLGQAPAGATGSTVRMDNTQASNTFKDLRIVESWGALFCLGWPGMNPWSWAEHPHSGVLDWFPHSLVYQCADALK